MGIQSAVRVEGNGMGSVAVAAIIVPHGKGVVIQSSMDGVRVHDLVSGGGNRLG